MVNFNWHYTEYIKGTRKTLLLNGLKSQELPRLGTLAQQIHTTQSGSSSPECSKKVGAPYKNLTKKFSKVGQNFCRGSSLTDDTLHHFQGPVSV